MLEERVGFSLIFFEVHIPEGKVLWGRDMCEQCARFCHSTCSKKSAFSWYIFSVEKFSVDCEDLWELFSCKHEIFPIVTHVCSRNDGCNPGHRHKIFYSNEHAIFELDFYHQGIFFSKISVIQTLQEWFRGLTRVTLPSESYMTFLIFIPQPYD